MCGSNSRQHKIIGKRLNRSQGFFPDQRIGITTTIVKCKKCRLVFPNPQPVPFDIQDHYGVPPEDYFDPSNIQIDPDYFSGEILKLKQLINFRKGMKSLDMGAGLGKAMISLEKAGFDAYGIEPSFEFHKHAISKMQLSPAKLLYIQIDKAEFQEATFDFISFGAVLEHLYDPAGALEKALNWLKPKGIIHIEVPSSEWLVGRITNLYYKLTFSSYVTNTSPMHAPYHLYEFSLDSFEAHASRAKYEIAFHEHYVCNTLMPKPLDNIFRWVMKHTNTGMQLCVWLRKS